MKTKISWFLVGFVVSWLIGAIVSFNRYRPRDYTQNWDELVPGQWSTDEFGQQWWRKAYGFRLGFYRMFAPANSSNASAAVQSLNADGLPGVVIQDNNADGILDDVLVADSACHHYLFDDENGDGVFDSFEYTTGIAPDSKTFRDDDMDGQYDFRMDESRIDSGSAFAVFIDSQWRDVVVKGNKHYVELKDKLARVELYPAVRLVEDD